MGLLSLFPAILVILLEPLIIVFRSFNKSTTTPASSAASSRATTPSSSRLPSRNPSRSPSLSRKPHHRHHHHSTASPYPSAPASPALRDITGNTNNGSVDKQGFAVPVPAALAVNAAAVSSVSNIVDGMVTHRKVNPAAIAASLPSSPQLSSF